MTAYYVEITNAFAPNKIADDPDRASTEFTDYLTSNGVTISTGGGVAFVTDYYDDSDVLQEGLFAIIDAEADPTTPAQVYDWSYTGAADIDGWLSDMQTFIDDGPGVASLTTTQVALKALMQYKGIPLDYS